MIRKTKDLHNISIEGFAIRTKLQYNTKTNHYTIGNIFQYRKQYYKDNKEKINKQSKEYYLKNKVNTKQYYINNRKLNTPTFGSKEDRINRSCAQQGINRKDFTGFLTDRKYCKLWTEKFRQSIRDRFHNKCYLCNKSKEDNGRKLSVHHVNYNKNCLCQKTCEFIPLCQSCHNKTNYNRIYWEDLIMNYLYSNRYFMAEI